MRNDTDNHGNGLNGFLVRRLHSRREAMRIALATSSWNGGRGPASRGVYLIEFAEENLASAATAFLARAGLRVEPAERPGRTGALFTADDETIMSLRANDVTPLSGVVARLQQSVRDADATVEWSLPDRVLRLDRPYIMGIVNVTPDSFYDGGRYTDAQAAVDYGLRLVDEGADILDIGGQSSRPGSHEIPEDEETRRVLSVVEGIHAHTDVPLSIDTYRAEVARTCSHAGATIVNDVRGLRGDDALLELIADERLAAVAMHMRGTPETMQQSIHYDDLVGEVLWFLAESVARAEAFGVSRAALAIDPGIGFGKTAEHNLEIVERLEEFHSLGRPVLLGASRKSFIGRALDRPADQRLPGTHAVTALAVAAGIQIIRVHDVAQTKEVARMAHAMHRCRRLEEERV